MACPPGRYWLAKAGSVMSGLVELGVISIRLAAEAIGDMALPEPLICGPTTAMTLVSATSSLVLVAAWAGSYWPAAAVPSSFMTGLILIWPAMPPRLLISSMARSEEHTSELQSRLHLVCRLL